MLRKVGRLLKEQTPNSDKSKPNGEERKKKTATQYNEERKNERKNETDPLLLYNIYIYRDFKRLYAKVGPTWLLRVGRSLTRRPSDTNLPKTG